MTQLRISEAQAQAEALARRASPYARASELSVRHARDWRLRQPSDLREAVRMVRHAYADEVPTKLHESPSDIGPDAYPKMTARAESYIFGSAQVTDQSDPDQMVSYLRTPFRALVDRMSHGDDKARLYAAIVRRVASGQGPQESATAEGVRPMCVAKDVAQASLIAFLRSLSDLRFSGRVIV